MTKMAMLLNPLEFHVYDRDVSQVARCATAQLAAALVGAAGSAGWAVGFHGTIIWNEGSEDLNAVVSAEGAADTMMERAVVVLYEEAQGRE